MNDAEFNFIVKERQSKITSILTGKARQYARGDRLSNFKRAAKALNCTPERALLGMAEKHFTAIRDYVADIECGSCMELGQWDEKIGDAINYLILLEGLVIERIGPNERPERHLR